MHLAKTGWNKDADILHDMTTCLEGCQSSVRIDSLTLPTLICKRKRSRSVRGTIYHLQFIPNSFYKKKIIQRKIDSLLLQTRLWCNKIQNIILTSFLMPVEKERRAELNCISTRTGLTKNRITRCNRSTRVS